MGGGAWGRGYFLMGHLEGGVGGDAMKTSLRQGYIVHPWLRRDLPVSNANEAVDGAGDVGLR